MIVTVEKRDIVGTLKTLLGTYSLLDNTRRFHGSATVFNVVDDEGFDNYITVSGEYVIVPAQVISRMDVKRLVKDGEKTKIPQELLVEQD